VELHSVPLSIWPFFDIQFVLDQLLDTDVDHMHFEQLLKLMKTMFAPTRTLLHTYDRHDHDHDHDPSSSSSSTTTATTHHHIMIIII